MKTKKLIIILIIIASILVLWNVWLQSRVFGLKVIEVSPKPNQTEVLLYPEIKIVFNQSLSLNQIKLGSDPSIDCSPVLLPDTKTVNCLPLSSLQKNTDYKINLIFNSQSYSWQFKTGAVEAGALPGWEQNWKKQEELYKREHLIDELVAKIKTKLPHKEDNFSIEYVPSNDHILIWLTKAPADKAKQDALKWFQNQGLENPEKSLKIDWFYTKDVLPPRTYPQEDY